VDARVAVTLALCVAGFYWLVVLYFVLLGASMRDHLFVTAEDGQKVIVSQDNFDGDIVTVLVPHSTFFYRWTNAGQELSGSEAVMRGDCTLRGCDAWRLHAGEPRCAAGPHLRADVASYFYVTSLKALHRKRRSRKLGVQVAPVRGLPGW
jgi:hypothetical protein